MKRNTPLLIVALFITQIALAQNTYVKKFVGAGAPGGFVSGDSATTRLKSPFGITTDKQGNIYLAENGNNCIRMITPQGVSSVFAGTGTAGFQDGPASSAKFNAPTGLCVDDSGNVFIADFQNHRIRKITRSTMMVSTLVGSGIAGYKDGPGDSARLNYPRGICMDSKGNLFVGDSWNHRIRIVYQANNSIDTYAGSGNIFGVQSVSDYKDGRKDTAHFYTPCEVKIDDQDNVYVADAYNHRIRKISNNDGMVTTVCGSGPSGSTNGSFQDGPAEQARLNTPVSLYVTPDGNTIYIGDGANNRVRKVESNTVSTLAGNASAGFQDGPGADARFNFPRGIAVNPANHKLLYVVDYNNNAVRKLYLDYAVYVNNINGSAKGPVFYPNPGNGLISFNTPFSSQDMQVRILNTAGTEVFKQQVVQSPETTINSNLEKGLYLIELTGAGFHTTGKLIIE